MKEGETVLFVNEQLFQSAKESIVSQLSKLEQLDVEGDFGLQSLRLELENSLRIIIEEEDCIRWKRVRQELKSVIDEG